MKKEKPLRKWEHLQEQTCLICKKPFVAKVYWCCGGTDLKFDHWIVSSVYCSTKCSRIGHKKLKEEQNEKDYKELEEVKNEK